MLRRRKDNALEDLIKGCINNDRKSQKILYDQYFEGLLTHCRSYKIPPEESVALINTTMLKVFQKIDTYASSGSFSSWIHIIHKRNILDHFRKKNNSTVELNEVIEAVSPTIQYHKDETDHIYSAIEYLPPKIKTVLKLYALEGYNHKEIAEEMEISEGTSRWYLNQARKLMSQKLKKNG